MLVKKCVEIAYFACNLIVYRTQIDVGASWIRRFLSRFFDFLQNFGCGVGVQAIDYLSFRHRTQPG